VGGRGEGCGVVDWNGGRKVRATINGEAPSLLKFINPPPSAVTIYSGAGANAILVPPGNIAVIAGGSSSGASSGFAKDMTLKGASDVAVAPNGAIYITDVRNKAVRKIDGSAGIVTTLNLPANKEYTGLGISSDGRLLVANFTDGSVHRESSAGSGSFTTFGGVGGNLLFVRDV